MTEQEWLTSKDPTAMLKHLEYHHGDNYDRKLRLFACACCRRIWDEIPSSRSRNAVEVAERYADGFATEEELGSAWYTARDAAEDAWCAAWENAANAALASAGGASVFASARSASLDSCDVYDDSDDAWESGRKTQAHILRDIVGNPFQPVTFQPLWQNQTILQLAQTMYGDHDFSAMPILGDALEEFGCDNEDFLHHCRDEVIHVRGCWVVDLILRKEI